MNNHNNDTLERQGTRRDDGLEGNPTRNRTNIDDLERVEEEIHRVEEEIQRVENPVQHGIRRLRRQIAELLIHRCPNGHAFDIDIGDDACVCPTCHHGFCASCGFDAGVGGDAQAHCLQVHGDYFANALDPTLAYRTNAPRVQREIIHLLQQEENENVQREIIDEITYRGEYDMWREHFDINAIQRGINVLQPAIIDQLEPGIQDGQDNIQDTIENPEESDGFVIVETNENCNNNNNNNNNNSSHTDLVLIRQSRHLQYQLQQLQTERDNAEIEHNRQQEEQNRQQEQQNRNNRTIANGVCPICGIEFPDEESPGGGVRMMCDVEGHFMCDDCFGTFVRTQSSAEHCFDNEERFEIPGCYDQDCQNRHEPLEAFDPRIIAVHVNNDTYEAFMNGQRLFTERRIYEEERRRIEQERRRVAEERERVANGVSRLRRQIAELLIFRCPNGHAFDYDGCDAVSECTICHHAFCAICGFDAGVGGDAHAHCFQVHGDYHARHIAPRVNAPRVQREIINLLQQEENEDVQREIIGEIAANRGEYDIWREHFDMNAIRRAVNAPQPAVWDQLVGNEGPPNNNIGMVRLPQQPPPPPVDRLLPPVDFIVNNVLVAEYMEDFYNSRLLIEVNGNRFEGTYRNGQGRINGEIINGRLENCQWFEGQNHGSFQPVANDEGGFDAQWVQIYPPALQPVAPWRITRIRRAPAPHGRLGPPQHQPRFEPPLPGQAQNNYGFLRQGRQDDLPYPNGLPVDNGGYVYQGRRWRRRDNGEWYRI